jgi:hypothetical protein
MLVALNEAAARERLNRIFGQLQDEHPRESAEQLFKRFSELMSSDPSLSEAFLLGGFSSICDEMLEIAPLLAVSPAPIDNVTRS